MAELDWFALGSGRGSFVQTEVAPQPADVATRSRLGQAWLLRKQDVILGIEAGLIPGNKFALTFDPHLKALHARILARWQTLATEETYATCITLIEKARDPAVVILASLDLLAAYEDAHAPERAEAVADQLAAYCAARQIAFIDPPPPEPEPDLDDLDEPAG